MRAAAVICARNEEVHIERVIEDTVAEGLDVVLIDNDSTDATVALARQFLGRGLLRIERLPWKGFLSWEGVLEAKRRVFEHALELLLGIRFCAKQNVHYRPTRQAGKDGPDRAELLLNSV